MTNKNTSLSLTIENFRSIRKTTLNLRPGVNILIGPNGSGKTCLLAALKFLRDIFTEGVGLAMAKSGGALRNYHRGESTIRFTTDHYYGLRVYRRKRFHHRFSWSLTIAQSGLDQIASIVEESLKIYVPDFSDESAVLSVTVNRSHNQPMYSYKVESSSILGKDVFNSATVLFGSKEEIINRVSSLLDKLAPVMKASGDQSLLAHISHIDPSLMSFVGQFINLNEYNILPDIARRATDQLPTAELSPNGAGLSEVIHALANKNYQRLATTRERSILRNWGAYNVHGSNYMISSSPYAYYPYRRLNPKHLDELIGKISKELSLAVRSITGLSTGIDPTNGKRFVLFEAGDQKFYPEEVSDGTIKWLSILVSIFVPYSTIYLLEEPENFLHPWMQQQLIRIMREQAENKVLFVLTTHSATILNAARVEEITIVSKNNGGTKTNHLDSLEQMTEMLEQSEFGLGDLWVSGLIGAVPAGDE